MRMPSKKFSIGLTAVLAIFSVTLVATGTRAAAQTETVLLSFNGSNGQFPFGGLIFDGTGNLYGTTRQGGAHNLGTVFELTPKAGGGWSEKLLHSFGNGVDGQNPSCTLVMDAAGNLYGTTNGGGPNGGGIAFELTPKASGGWSEKLVHSFGFVSLDGTGPNAGLIFDASGNLYGTTINGGAYGDGTVFELTLAAGGGWAEKILHHFRQNGRDGFFPFGSLILDAAGNLYGTTQGGGRYYYGTVFELTPTARGPWSESILHDFNQNGTDGGTPLSNLIFDAAGDLYGTTAAGGTYGYGTAFELIPAGGGAWTEEILHSFDITDGSTSWAGLIFAGSGNLYGTTVLGGPHNNGTVFKLTPTTGGGWTEQVLYAFDAQAGINGPYDGLILDAAGNLYGTAENGGPHGAYGTVFEVTP
jgi:uncharacterized repeat protein (TIGR03803 family)